MRQRLGYVPALDGVRGVAILLVVAFHVTGWPVGGSYGVDLFFVLSGFLITSLLIEEHAATGTVRLRGFYARRARRLLPALVVLLAVYLLLGGGWRHVALYGLYIGNVYQAVWVTHPTGHVGLEHLWSLATEEQFYLVWPAALLVILKAGRPGRWLAALLVVFACWRLGIILHGANAQRLVRAPDTHAEGLLAGALLAWKRPTVGEGWAQASVCGVLALAIIGQAKWATPLFEISAAGMVAAAVSPTQLARGLAWKPLVYLGRISYSLYLWHFMLLWAFHWHHRPLVAVLSGAAAVVSTRYVEQPFRRPLAASPLRRLRGDAQQQML